MINKIDSDANLNLRIKPTKHTHKITQFTVGDLHANFVKLIYVLIRNGVCQLSTPKYNELVALYEQKPPLTKQQLQQFRNIIDRDLHIIDTSILVRLIGDIIADRGRNDYFVLKILSKLKQAKVPLSILMSNHDQTFLTAYGAFGQPLKEKVDLKYEKQFCRLTWQNKQPQPNDFNNKNISEYIVTPQAIFYYDDWDSSIHLVTDDPEQLDKFKKRFTPNQPIDQLNEEQLEDLYHITDHKPGVSQACSYIELQRSITNGLIEKQEIDQILKEAYFPHLKLLDYTFEDGYLTIISHAPIDLLDIEQVAQQFEVPYQGPNIEGLIRTITAINQEFRYAVHSNITEQVLAKGMPAYKILWQREDELYKARSNLDTLSHIPNIRFLYGHDKTFSDASFAENVIRIDNHLGQKGLDSYGETNISYISNDAYTTEDTIDFSIDRRSKKYIKQALEDLNTKKLDLQAESKALKKAIRKPDNNRKSVLRPKITDLNDAIENIIHLTTVSNLGTPLTWATLLDNLSPYINEIMPVPKKKLLNLPSIDPRFIEQLSYITCKGDTTKASITGILEPFLAVSNDPKIIALSDHLQSSFTLPNPSSTSAPKPVPSSTTLASTPPLTKLSSSSSAAQTSSRTVAKDNTYYHFLMQFMAHRYTRRVLTICIIAGFVAAMLSLGALTGPAGWTHVAKVCAGFLHTSPMVLGISGAGVTASTVSLRGVSMFACSAEEKKERDNKSATHLSPPASKK